MTDFLSSRSMSSSAGCYIMPFFLVAIGGAVLYRMQSERMSLRVTLGLSLILVALLGIIALFTPTTGTGPAALFDRIALVTHGGYVGAALAWVGLTLFRPAISAILLIGVAIVGVIVIGFSISAFLRRCAPLRLGRRGCRLPHSRCLRIYEAGRGKPPLTTMAESADLPPAAHGAPTARISLGEQPRRRSRRGYGRRRARCGRHAAAGRPEDGWPRAHSGSGSARGGRGGGHLRCGAGRPHDPQARAAPPGGRGRRARGRADEAREQEDGPPRKRRRLQAQPISKDGFQLPPMNLLATGGARRGSTEEEREVAAELQGTLEDFGVMASVVGWVEGPHGDAVQGGPALRRAREQGHQPHRRHRWRSPPRRAHLRPIPGTNYVGIEVPNRNRQMVYLPDVLAAAGPGPLQVAIGEDVEGHAIVHDLAKMPHVLIAGTTGSGKSVEVNSMIMSILMRATPAEVRFIMVDPKRVEFAPLRGIPHLYVPVVTECREASSALSWAVAEMERRLKMFSKCGVRNIITFNE